MTGITIAGANRKDKTGFVLSDEYTKEYEVGVDLQKFDTLGSLNLYSMNIRKHKLVFNGLSEADAIDTIPLGVYFPAEGEYTFAFDDQLYNSNEVDTIMLIDYQKEIQKNLKYGNYTFTAHKGTDDSRFAILIRLAKKPDIETDLEEIYDAEGPRKVIINNQLFIIKEGEMYNAVGTKVR